MRIISGTAKGTKLYTLEGLNTRPTLDRVKESLFNIIANYIKDSVVLDLFSGSGAIGLEFACKIIERNIEKTHLKEKVELYNEEFKILIKKLKDIKFDIIYLDPPYNTDYIKIAIKLLNENNNITNETILITETDDEKVIKQIEEINSIEIIDKRKYGRAYILFLKKINGKEE